MLNRIARYLGAQNWNAIAIEFLIVTAGVLMGIQVSNWNDNRVEKARLDQQLASLRTELEGNLATVRKYQRFVGGQLGDIVALERAFDRGDEPDAGIDRKLMDVFRIQSMILETSAYDELKDSGSFRHVDADIRSAITAWQGRKGRMERVDQDALSYRANSVDHMIGTLDFASMARSFATPFPPAGNAPLRNDPVRLAKDAKVRNFLAMRYAIETQKLHFATELERSTENLLFLLERRQ